MGSGFSAVMETTVDTLQVRVFENRASMGLAAGVATVEKIKEVLSRKQYVRMVFAAAPSQNELLEYLCRVEGVDWSRVVAFHMDEYIGLPEAAPQRFAAYLQEHLFEHVRPFETHLLQSNNDPSHECARYAGLLCEAPIDIVCLGIGENGHIAFNDPGVADFHDPAVIKPVQLDEACRMQQVHDGCFPDLASVPTTALTLTVPTLLSASHLICVVPGQTKREAVRRTLTESISSDCPASILRTHRDCTLYLDIESYGVTADGEF
ncbi:glucosamine-6-phosphate deaminase [Alicyclobacillus fastidiosus]|uniref:Glucosamine-6-phosphate deaminase n=1 Tax=Alicyclobacillus fastidiosus TaxID=392011 RepID=A0ABV5AEQ9_9BACL|nr:glucosamine-6-phosphate deaminase [Alicyclobacillus fastidiosus]WEH09753.1 glucosamine-6-phosphate deaminase [Alicyclobacillus fastidiosus]